MKAVQNLLMIGCAALLAGAVTAQDNNLLRQGGFEDDYAGRGRPDLNIPGAWSLWLANAPQTEEWQNRGDRVYAFPHTVPPEVRSGSASLNLNGGYVTFTAAIYQQAHVAAGDQITASAWAWLHACNFPKDAQGNITGGMCESSPESGAFVKVGIDPNGGLDPNDTDIVWSAPARPHDRWEQVMVDAVAASPLVTVFLYVTQARPTDLNNVYWDDAALVPSQVAHPIMLAPVTTLERQFGSLPVPQPPQFDGSIIHVVQPGDTIDGIALVYGVTRAQILSLNLLPDPRVLYVGQPIIVKRMG